MITTKTTIFTPESNSNQNSVVIYCVILFFPDFGYRIYQDDESNVRTVICTVREEYDDIELGKG